jgi:hypothetical protein
VNIEMASENILTHFYGDEINKNNVMSLINDVTKKYSCPYTLFFFYRSLANQSSKEPIRISISGFQTMLNTYLQKHYATIHPSDISQQFPIFTQTPDYEEYSVDDWKWKEVSIGRPTFVKNRRKRIIERGSSNQSHPKYSSYFDVRSISEFAKKNRKNANEIQKLFTTNEYWGAFAFPYFSPSDNYDRYRSVGSLLWSVSQNQYLTTLYKKKNLKHNQIRFENIETFTNFDVEAFYKSLRFPYDLDDFKLQKLLTNISTRYYKKFTDEVYKKLDKSGGTHGVAPLSFYIQSFNFGIEKPPLVLPPFDFKEVIIESARPTELWRKQ